MSLFGAMVRNGEYVQEKHETPTAISIRLSGEKAGQRQADRLYSRLRLQEKRRLKGPKDSIEDRASHGFPERAGSW